MPDKLTDTALSELERTRGRYPKSIMVWIWMENEEKFIKTNGWPQEPPEECWKGLSRWSKARRALWMPARRIFAAESGASRPRQEDDDDTTKGVAGSNASR
ncbi:hypothetical protein LTR85_004520 [Meristemomyces frigidus]|nr:hypothetical protein LTR85_004520 [Meristemomyces frigidus]